MAGCSSAGEMVMMGYCCRSSSLSHSGGREREDGVRERKTEGEGLCSCWGGALIPIGPQDMSV